MAYPDYGALMPTEALFSEPGAYAGVLKGEALKRASYLSQMDQFYAELEESTRRFEKEYSLAEREMEDTLWQHEFSEKTLASQEKMAGAELDLRRELGLGELALGQSELNFKRSSAHDFLRLEQEKLDKTLSGEEEFKLASDWLRENMGGRTSSNVLSPTRTSEPSSYVYNMIDRTSGTAPQDIYSSTVNGIRSFTNLPPEGDDSWKLF